jgi:E3 ubiquitin-protein ligase HERC2
MALTDSGSVYTWGEGLYGKLGHGEIYSPHSAKRQCSTPKKVDGMEGRGTRQISCGGQHCLAVTVRGKLFTWGQAGHFLGLGNEDDDAFSPSLVRGGGTKDKFIIHADGGGCHSILVAAPHIGSGALHI